MLAADKNKLLIMEQVEECKREERFGQMWQVSPRLRGDRKLQVGSSIAARSFIARWAGNGGGSNLPYFTVDDFPCVLFNLRHERELSSCKHQARTCVEMRG